MTVLTKEMIDAFPVANLHAHLPGVIAAEVALELGLRNNLVRIENGKILPACNLPNIPEDVRYRTFADIFLWDNDENGQICNVRYNIVEHAHETFDEFDQVMGIVQGHKYSYEEGGRLRPVGGLQKPEDISFVLDKCLENCLRANVKYLELQQNIYLSQIIFSHLEKRDAQRAFFEVLKQAQVKFAGAGVTLNFVQCFNKSSGMATEEQAVAKSLSAVDDLLYAQQCYPGLFVKLNSAGNETVLLAHPEYQRAAYAIARKSEIVLDCHAGEARGWQAIIDATEQLGVRIIGHGFRVVESAQAMRHAAERKLIFMVCPSMNMFLGAKTDTPDGMVKIETIWQHPFWQMLREDVDGKYLKVSLATDNPDLGGVPYKVMVMQLAGLLPEMVGKMPKGFKPLSAEELHTCAKNSLEAIPNLGQRIMYEQALDSWAQLSLPRGVSAAAPFSPRL